VCVYLCMLINRKRERAIGECDLVAFCLELYEYLVPKNWMKAVSTIVGVFTFVYLYKNRVKANTKHLYYLRSLRYM